MLAQHTLIARFSSRLTQTERLHTDYGLCPKNQTTEVLEEPPTITQTSEY